MYLYNNIIKSSILMVVPGLGVVHVDYMLVNAPTVRAIILVWNHDLKKKIKTIARSFCQYSKRPLIPYPQPSILPINKLSRQPSNIIPNAAAVQARQDNNIGREQCQTKSLLRSVDADYPISVHDVIGADSLRLTK